MSKAFLVSLVGLTLCLPISNKAKAATSFCPIPDGFEVTEKTMSWQSASKPVTLVNLWAIWCPPCLKELPMLDSIAAKANFAIDTLHIGNNPQEISSRFEELGIKNLPDTLEPDFSKLGEWGFHGLPATMVVVNNEVLYRHSGYVHTSSEELEAWLDCLAKEAESIQ